MKKVKVLSVAVAALLAVAPITTTIANESATTVQAAIHHKRSKKVTKKARRHVKKHAKKRTKRAKAKKKGIDWKHTSQGDLSDLPMKDRIAVLKGDESAGYARANAKVNKNWMYTGPNADVVNPITGEK